MYQAIGRCGQFMQIFTGLFSLVPRSHALNTLLETIASEDRFEKLGIIVDAAVPTQELNALCLKKWRYID
jgi:hypothetical protein